MHTALRTLGKPNPAEAASFTWGGQRARPRKRIERSPVTGQTYRKPPGSCQTRWPETSISVEIACCVDCTIAILDPTERAEPGMGLLACMFAEHEQRGGALAAGLLWKETLSSEERSPVRILLIPIFNLEIVHTLEVEHPAPAHSHPGDKKCNILGMLNKL